MKTEQIIDALESEGEVLFYKGTTAIKIIDEMDSYSIAIYRCENTQIDNYNIDENFIFLDSTYADTTDPKYAIKWALDLAKDY